MLPKRPDSQMAITELRRKINANEKIDYRKTILDAWTNADDDNFKEILSLLISQDITEVKNQVWDIFTTVSFTPIFSIQPTNRTYLVLCLRSNIDARVDKFKYLLTSGAIDGYRLCSAFNFLNLASKESDKQKRYRFYSYYRVLFEVMERKQFIRLIAASSQSIEQPLLHHLVASYGLDLTAELHSPVYHDIQYFNRVNNSINTTTFFGLLTYELGVHYRKHTVVTSHLGGIITSTRNDVNAEVSITDEDLDELINIFGYDLLAAHFAAIQDAKKIGCAGHDDVSYLILQKKYKHALKLAKHIPVARKIIFFNLLTILQNAPFEDIDNALDLLLIDESRFTAFLLDETGKIFDRWIQELPSSRQKEFMAWYNKRFHNVCVASISESSNSLINDTSANTFQKNTYEDSKQLVVSETKSEEGPSSAQTYPAIHRLFNESAESIKQRNSSSTLSHTASSSCLFTQEQTSSKGKQKPNNLPTSPNDMPLVDLIFPNVPTDELQTKSKESVRELAM